MSRLLSTVINWYSPWAWEWTRLLLSVDCPLTSLAFSSSEGYIYLPLLHYKRKKMITKLPKETCASAIEKAIVGSCHHPVVLHFNHANEFIVVCIWKSNPIIYSSACSGLLLLSTWPSSLTCFPAWIRSRSASTCWSYTSHSGSCLRARSNFGSFVKGLLH